MFLDRAAIRREFNVHVVIVGCGRVGSSLAHNLVDAGHTVAIVDRKPQAFERLGKNFSGQVLSGIGFDRDLLVEAGIERAEAVAAVTNGDNSNILVARVARETFGIERVVARIYDPQRAAVYERLGIATVAPALWTTERVLRRLLPDAAAVEWTDPSAKVSLVERSLGGAWAGQALSELEGPKIRIVAVSRLGEAMLPTPNLVVQEGDVVYLAVATDAIAQLDELTARPSAGHGH
jgi:trk system potassium uptake protein TrkA